MVTNVNQFNQDKKETFNTSFNSQYDKHLITSLSMANMPKYSVEEIINHKSYMSDLGKILDKEHTQMIYRVVIDKTLSQFTQITDVLVPKCSKIDFNMTYILRTRADKEYYVRIKASENESVTSEQEIIITNALATILEVSKFEKVFLEEKDIHRNLVEKIELIPVTNLQVQIAKNVEEKFKKFVVRSTRLLPLILNQNQVLKLDDYVVTVKLYPECIRAASVDAEVLRKSIIEVRMEGLRSYLTSMLREPLLTENKTTTANFLKFPKFESIVNTSICKLQENLQSCKVFSKVHKSCILNGIINL